MLGCLIAIASITFQLSYLGAIAIIFSQLGAKQQNDLSQSEAVKEMDEKVGFKGI